MTIRVQSFGGVGEVTGSCHLIEVDGKRLLLDCGLIQGPRQEEMRNFAPFPFNPVEIDAVVLSHAHIDHSGRLPLLIKDGFRGRVHTHEASIDLCQIMLKDSGFLNEKDAEIENRKRARKGLAPVEPLYTAEDADIALDQFSGLEYGEKRTILPGVTVRLSDAGHILGSAITELWLGDGEHVRKLVYSGDLGRSGMPILEDPTPVRHADLVMMESTYGDRLHRNWEDTLAEIRAIFDKALSNGNGNVLIPAFAVGRTQEILYLFAKYYDELGLDRWRIFLDSPMAIEATGAYAENSGLFDDEALEMWRRHRRHSLLPNLHFTRTAQESMQLNKIRSGAIIIAGSGMCNGGRIRHHFKHNIWRRDCDVVITGFQARGTLGRALVDGADEIRLWGEGIKVAAKIHTIGGLSAHADRDGLTRWYQGFEGRPPLVLVHGEEKSLQGLSDHIRTTIGAPIRIAKLGQKLDLTRPIRF